MLCSIYASSLINGFKNLLAIAVLMDIDFAQADTVSIFVEFVHFAVHPTVCTVKLLIQAGSPIQAGGFRSLVSIEAGSLIEAGSPIQAG